MKKLVLVALVLLIAAAPVFAATVKTLPIKNCLWNVYQAYDLDPGAGALAFKGYAGLGDATITAVPGILSIVPGVNPNFANPAFPKFWSNYAWVDAVTEGWYVKSAQLTKYRPVVGQCQYLFGPAAAFTQTENYGAGDKLGSKIRLWWPLMFEAPGTIWQLIVNTGTFNIVTNPTNGDSGTIHTDYWTWMVDVTWDSIIDAMTLFHEVAFGQCEYPLIQDEKLWNHDLVSYDSSYNPPKIIDELRYDKTLVCQVEAIKALTEAGDLDGARLLVVDLENNLNAACNMSATCVPGAPPTNTTATLRLGVLGIANTACFPACCKLIIDVEAAANKYGIFAGKWPFDVIDRYGKQFDPTTGMGYNSAGVPVKLYDPLLPGCTK